MGTADGNSTGYKVRGTAVLADKIDSVKPVVVIKEEKTGKTFAVLAPIGGAV